MENMLTDIKLFEVQNSVELNGTQGHSPCSRHPGGSFLPARPEPRGVGLRSSPHPCARALRGPPEPFGLSPDRFRSSATSLVVDSRSPVWASKVLFGPPGPPANEPRF